MEGSNHFRLELGQVRVVGDFCSGTSAFLPSLSATGLEENNNLDMSVVRSRIAVDEGPRSDSARNELTFTDDVRLNPHKINLLLRTTWMLPRGVSGLREDRVGGNHVDGREGAQAIMSELGIAGTGTH
eukprot:414973-Amphidinium_carterae.4